VKILYLLSDHLLLNSSVENGKSKHLDAVFKTSKCLLLLYILN